MMKKLILAVLFAGCMYTATGQQEFELAKPKTEAKATDKVYTDSKGVRHTVYVSKNGKYFYKKVSKNGNEYNVYLKPTKQ